MDVSDPKAHIDTLVQRLRWTRPNATYELDWETPEQMLVATILAAQCTDERVNRVTKTLFKKYPSPRAFADADLRELEIDLKPTGFYRQKARSVKEVNKTLVRRFGGKCPDTMAQLTTLPGVARKTANVVLNCCFDIPSGIIVDTHVARVSQRMGLTNESKPERIERDLMKRVPQKDWTFFGPAYVLHGRYVCKAKTPNCAGCDFLDICPRKGVSGARPSLANFTPPQPPPAPVSAWVEHLAAEMDKPYFGRLLEFVEREREQHTVYPPEDQVFSAFSLTPFDDVKVVILGQDPYHGPGQAHGLSFSVKPGVPLPPSLKNIYKELKSDLRVPLPQHGSLEAWAKQGVLMINSVLTVREHKPNSHKNQGWETFIDAVIRKLSDERDHVVFLLWGNYAQKKARLIHRNRHTIIKTAHPSPLSARNGFFGSKPFSRINKVLKKKGIEPINWQLPMQA